MERAGPGKGDAAPAAAAPASGWGEAFLKVGHASLSFVLPLFSLLQT